MSDKNQSQATAKPVKTPGPIRWGAIVFFAVFIGFIGAYAHFFLDHHLKTAMEWGGYSALGVQVDVGQVKTSFWNLSLQIEDIGITNRENPMTNSISIGDIRMALLWDGLLRAKFVMNEAAVEQIEFLKPRKSAGRVRPPAPPSNEPSLIEKEAEKVKALALEKAEQKGADNVFGDLIALLQGGSGDAQLDQFKGKLISENQAKALEAEVKKKQEEWQARLKTLPQGKEFEELGQRLGKVQTRDFKSLDEVQKSIQAIDAIIKEGDAKVKAIQSAGQDLNGDLNKTQNQIKDLEKQIQADIKSIEQHFRLPQLDPKTISRAIFQQYIGKYLAQANEYKGMAEKYLPPKFKNKKTGEVDESIQPHPREKGVVYEFGSQKAYPLFWIKKVSVSSQAGTSPYSGNIAGEIRHITSNQKLVGAPTTAELSGEFPAQKVKGFESKLVLNNLKPQSEVTLDFAVASYPTEGRSLIESPDVQIGFEKADSQLGFKSKLVDLKEFSFELKNTFREMEYQIGAKNEMVQSTLQKVFQSLPAITLEVFGQGELPTPSLNINSNLGPELATAFGREIQAKIDEARARIEKQVRAEIEKYRTQIDAEVNKIRSQVQGELDKLNKQAEAQKKLAENKTNEAKKDNEDKAKKQLEKEGQKAVDDLKKRFGF